MPRPALCRVPWSHGVRRISDTQSTSKTQNQTMTTGHGRHQQLPTARKNDPFWKLLSFYMEPCSYETTNGGIHVCTGTRVTRVHQGCMKIGKTYTLGYTVYSSTYTCTGTLEYPYTCTLKYVLYCNSMLVQYLLEYRYSSTGVPLEYEYCNTDTRMCVRTTGTTSTRVPGYCSRYCNTRVPSYR